ncbi:Zn(2)-C6 fungal-type domain-containing protein [Abortiporus biennis]
MAESPDISDSMDSGDDGNLTIRIPNPKVYMARQSQWKGRRGKPRCDHCRLNNLKCDRVLPTCNHCAWANGRECKYTPLPTPAHRGIPRCDRCRKMNLKCDRNLPVCNHCAEENVVDCNYTPKKRHKVPSDHGVSDVPAGQGGPVTAADSGMIAGPSGSHVFESEIRTEPQIRQYIPPQSPASRDGEPSIEGGEVEHSTTQTTADGNFTWGMIVTTPHIDPWTHPSFAPLPDAILSTLRNVNAIEMPTRHAFDEALTRFVAMLSPELRETATFPPEVYADLARAVAGGTIAELLPRLRMWATCHHARSGSRKSHLVLLPRDAFYNMNPADEEKLRANFIVQTDGENNGSSDKYSENAGSSLESAAVFERVPVQPQIYDVLVYTHRSHGPPATMLFEARRIGIATITWPMVEMFIRTCPISMMGPFGSCFHLFSIYNYGLLASM